MGFVPATRGGSYGDGPRVIDSRINEGARHAMDTRLERPEDSP